MERKTFIDTIAPLAIENYKKYGVLPSLTIAQAANESGWGGSGLTQKANNLFGVKGKGNAGSVKYKTNEWVNGKYETVDADFRAYDSWAASLDDYGQLLNKPLYKNVLAAKDYREAAYEVKQAGYATSPTYTKSLIELIESNDLARFDEVAKSGGTLMGGVDMGSVTDKLDGFFVKSAFFIGAVILGTLGIYWLFKEPIDKGVKAYVTGGASLVAEGGK